MSLKDCIRSRTLAAIEPEKTPHIPYRNSKLTLMLKDSFELESTKHCKTIIIANVSPSVSDLAATKNTLRFIVPIKVGSGLKKNIEHLKPDKLNPVTWDNKMLRDWCNQYSKSKVDCDKFCPYESGKQILAIPEQEFIQRLMQQGFLEAKCK